MKRKNNEIHTLIDLELELEAAASIVRPEPENGIFQTYIEDIRVYLGKLDITSELSEEDLERIRVQLMEESRENE